MQSQKIFLRTVAVAAVLMLPTLTSIMAAETAATVGPGTADARGEGRGVSPVLISTFAELARSAPVVVRGTVIAQTSRLTSRKLIVTDIKLRVDEVISGSYTPRELTLTTLGGRLGGEELEVGHMPRFVVGKSYIVFADPSRDTYDPVVGNEGGVFQVAENGEVLTYHGAKVLGVAGDELRLGAIVPGAVPATSPSPRAAGEPMVSGGVRTSAARATADSQAAAMTAVAFGQTIRGLK